VEAEIGCRRFLDRFEAEYGNVHPQLLDCNFHQACQRAKTEVKLLVVYLHCQYHINTPSFCRTIFSSQSFVEFLDSNMLVWVGDVASTDGLTAANHLQASSYPYLGVVAPVESGLMTIGKLEGTFTEDQARVVMVSLLESFSALAAVQLAEREAASAERDLRSAQEREFEEALAADRDRERQHSAQQEQEAEEQAQRELDEAIRLSKEAEREEQMRRKRQRIPPEPEAGPGVAKIMFVMPDGVRVTRRFQHEDTVEILYDYTAAALDESGVRGAEFKLRTTFPKAVLGDMQMSVKQAGLVPSAQVLVTLDKDDEDDEESESEDDEE